MQFNNIVHVFLVSNVVCSFIALAQRKNGGLKIRYIDAVCLALLKTGSKSPLFVIQDARAPMKFEGINDIIQDHGKGLQLIKLDHSQSDFQYIFEKTKHLLGDSFAGSKILIITDSGRFLDKIAETFVKLQMLTVASNVVILSNSNYADIMESMQKHWMYRMMNVIAFNIAYNGSVKILEYEPFPLGSPPGIKTKAIEYLEPASIEGYLQFSDKYSSFRGHTLNIAILPYEPYWIQENIKLPGGRNYVKISGLDGLTYNTIAESLNFKTNILPCRDWSEVDRLVANGTALLSPVKFYMYYSRYEQYRFTVAFDVTNTKIILQTPEYAFSWTSLLDPLSYAVWVTVLLVIVATSSVMVYLVGRKPLSIRNGFHVVIETWKLIISQPSNMKFMRSTSISSSLAMGFLGFGFFVANAYKSSLIAYITLPKAPNRIDTLEQFSTSDIPITIPVFSKPLKVLLQTSESGYAKMIGDSMTLVKNHLNGLKIALQKQSGYACDYGTYLNVAAANFQTNTFYAVQQPLFTALLGFPVPHNAPYVTQFDKKILQILNAGLRIKWHNDIVRSLQRKRRQLDGREQFIENSKEPKMLHIDHLKGPLFVLCCGWVLASVVFLVEIVFHTQISHVGLSQTKLPIQ